MKKRLISSIIAIATVTSALGGCGISQKTSSETAATAYVEAEYPQEEYPQAYPEEAACEEAYYGDEYSDTEYEDAAYACDDAEEYCASEAYGKNAYDSTSDSYAVQASKTFISGGYEESTLCPGDYYPPFGYDEGEKYRSVSENPFSSVSSSPLSTFGADIDTASYANLRRMIEDGYSLSDIPFGSIRTEELVNYFNYDYKKPNGKDPFAVNAAIIDCPWNKDTKLVNLGIKAKELSDTKDIPSNIVFLVDVSGSMNDYDKLPLLKMGLEMLVDDLDGGDRLSIVTYASSSDVVLAGAKGSEHSKIKRAINNLSAGGSTNGGEGIKTAYDLAEKYFIKGGNNRVIMATDGDLNVGITSEDELEKLISKKKESGVFLSVLGFGTGNYNEAALETLADKGNGNYSYIDCLAEAKKVLVDEFDSTLFTIAKDVKFQIEFNPAYVEEYRLIGYENRSMAAKDFNDDKKDGGEIGSGHQMTVMYEIKLADEKDDDDINLRYQKNDLSEKGKSTDEWMTVSVRYKEPDEDESKLIYFPISSRCYTKRPDCDTLFAAYVAECGMIINDSEYVGNMRMKDVSRQISKLALDDEYKEEFLELVRQL